MRNRFDKKLNELRDEILKMGDMVGAELELALSALEQLDTDMATQVFTADKAVNDIRYAVEEKCFTLIVTQQPAARDLRAIITVLNMIVDLERMGDQAKGIARVIPHILKHPGKSYPPQLGKMGSIVGKMLRDVMTAYVEKNVTLARNIALKDDEVDGLYAHIFTQMMELMAEAQYPDQVEARYEILRAARELERFGDLATNLAERVIYLTTGNIEEINI